LDEKRQKQHDRHVFNAVQYDEDEGKNRVWCRGFNKDGSDARIHTSVLARKRAADAPAGLQQSDQYEDGEKDVEGHGGRPIHQAHVYGSKRSKPDIGLRRLEAYKTAENSREKEQG
jgi:hypothetical protein